MSNRQGWTKELMIINPENPEPNYLTGPRITTVELSPGATLTYSSENKFTKVDFQIGTYNFAIEGICAPPADEITKKMLAEFYSDSDSDSEGEKEKTCSTLQ